MTTQEKRQILVKELLRHLGSKEKVKAFSENLRTLNIVDLRDDEQFEKAAKHEFTFMASLITYQQFGLLDKLVEIRKLIHDQDTATS